MPDRRALLYCLYGPRDAAPLVFLNGTPGTRYMMTAKAAERFAAAGVRALAYDRPGYGGSTRRPGRTVAMAVDDIRALVDGQGWDRFSIVGVSGGGPHALATAALLGDRVTRCAAVVSPAPPDADGLAWFDGMTQGNVQEFRLAQQGESAYRPLVERLGADAFERIERGEPPLPADDYDLSESDLAELRRRLGSPEPGRVERARAVWIDGYDGWIDDAIAFTKPWGFQVSSITVPVAIWFGAQDVLSPRGHAEWLLRRIPGAVHEELSGGHLANDADFERILAWLRG